MAEKKYLDLSGLTSFLANLRNSFANKSHTHETSEITDFPSIPTATSDLVNDSNFTDTKVTIVRWE